ncbi:MAG TPA: valine--tRNA ligase [Bacillota bacterium]
MGDCKEPATTAATAPIPSVYDPKSVEDRWYQYWLEGGFFRAEVDPKKEPYCIVIPPPNITGSLHMGHALNNTIQDVLIRWHRMRGLETLWQPGSDHAGIATQVKVEEELAKQGISRHDLGREGFVAKVWEWKEKYNSTILKQLYKLGASCDWSRLRFTLDEGLSRAVREVFVRLYEKGLIYKGKYIVNWCPDCHTAISDIEVEHSEETSSLWHLNYPLEGGEGYVTVATTRPETMLGDTAVAVNPKDERYQKLVGKTVILPVLGRRLPIIADDYVDPSFGTGAVKVTPAHDPNDFEMAQRHNLPAITVIDEDGKMTAEAGPVYAGQDRLACRQALVEQLRAEGQLLKIEPYTHSVGHCSRCATIIEPLISTQWFVKMKPLAEPAMEAVRRGEVQFVPERFARIYLNWMENIRDWCISRQLWWGHRIPAWHCQKCGRITVAREDPTECAHCGADAGQLVQEEDVLDTWFSSALWPFSTLGWPDQTPELKYFYPTNVLVTAYDIIFFWVARMIFSGLEFMGGKPFDHVLITGLVRDSEGRKMAKSLGNGIDPLEVIKEYGADALRFTVLTGNTPGNDMRFYWERVESSRNFANKIWNASRFALMNLGDFDPDRDGLDLPREGLELEDRWIISRFNRASAEADRFLEAFELGEAARVLYDFVWDELCDWYIELIKGRLAAAGTDTRRTAQRVLAWVLDRTLRLLHPFIPFITEEIWQHLPSRGPSIMVAEWPVADPGLVDDQAEGRLGAVMEVIKAIRNIRAEINLPPGKKADVIIHPTNIESREAVKTGLGHIVKLAGVAQLEVASTLDERPPQALSAIAGGAEIFVPLRGLIDVDREVARVDKEIQATGSELTKIDGRLANQGFLAKAPAEVIDKERVRRQELADKLIRLKERREQIAGR